MVIPKSVRIQLIVIGLLYMGSACVAVGTPALRERLFGLGLEWYVWILPVLSLGFYTCILVQVWGARSIKHDLLRMSCWGALICLSLVCFFLLPFLLLAPIAMSISPAASIIFIPYICWTWLVFLKWLEPAWLLNATGR